MVKLDNGIISVPMKVNNKNHLIDIKVYIDFILFPFTCNKLTDPRRESASPFHLGS